MTPRLEIDLSKIALNARTLVKRLGSCGVSVTGVTKATLGSVPIAQTMLKAGVKAIGESRSNNIKNMQGQLGDASVWMLRAPMAADAADIVAAASLSFATELDTIAALSAAAGRQSTVHDVLLMVELGDLREGILAKELIEFVRQTLRFKHIRLVGIGSNLACRCGVEPDAANMAELSTLADKIEHVFDIKLPIVSGGNSANLDWVLGGAKVGRINNLRLGESILLGREPLHRKALPGLHTDAFVLVAEVIESKSKPLEPWGKRAQTSFSPAPIHGTMLSGSSGARATNQCDRLSKAQNQIQSILALGHQDVSPSDLLASPGVEILGASSDHLMIAAGARVLPIGSEQAFNLNYAGLLRAMTSPFVVKKFV